MDTKELKEKIKISKGIARLIDITPKGEGKFMALCPFHDDHNPSLHINDQKGLFRCFSCNTVGDLITFYQNYLSLSFPETIKRIVGEFNLNDSIGNNFKQDQHLFYKVNEMALKLYTRNKTGHNKADFDDFLKKRHISHQIACDFEVGISGGSDQLYSYIKSFKNIEDKDKYLETALALGLIMESREGGQYYDTFKNRIIFPIRNKRGDLCGFSGRALFKNSSAKFINSRESPVFIKNQVLYNENNIFNSSNNKDISESLFIVEGYMDAIRLYQHGYTSVVALMGVNLREDFIKKILSVFKIIYLCLDNDDAGLKASKKISSLFLKELYLPKVVNLDPFNDPDDFFLENTSKEWEERLKDAAPILKIRS